MLSHVNISFTLLLLGQCTFYSCCSPTNELAREVLYQKEYFHEDQHPLKDKGSYCQHSIWCTAQKCTNKVSMLRLGHCMTFEEDKGLFVVRCPYFQLRGHNETGTGYFHLPNNISDLNDYMCKPMNRKGLLCKDSIDGFGTSVTSVGYMCSNCTSVWYGVPLYLLVELLPVTLFYMVIFTLQIRLTSAAMTCFIMYSQLIILELVVDRRRPVEQLSPTNPLYKVTLVLYGIWNLDFFRYVLPPFCVNSNLQLVHIALLGYVSILFPVCLIILSWTCIELHDRNCQLLVCLWRQFHKYCEEHGIGNGTSLMSLPLFLLLFYSNLCISLLPF